MGTNVVPLTKKGEPLSERSDDDLMLLACRGAHAAFEALVRRHGRRVIAFCAKHVGDRALAEELAQETWFSVWDHRADYRAEGKFLLWLLTVARNRARNARRDLARRAVVAEERPSPAPDVPAMSASEIERVLATERAVRIERALTGLSEALREAVILRFAEELPYADVARILETNESTARSRVFHGLRELRRRLRGES